LSPIYNVSQLSSGWNQRGSAYYTKNTKAETIIDIRSQFDVNNSFQKIQVLGLLGHLSTYITILTLNAYQTVRLTVTLLTYVMRILILRWASHLDAFSGYPLHT
jgi:hypothetical protein